MKDDQKGENENVQIVRVAHDTGKLPKHKLTDIYNYSFKQDELKRVLISNITLGTRINLPHTICRSKHSPIHSGWHDVASRLRRKRWLTRTQCSVLHQVFLIMTVARVRNCTTISVNCILLLNQVTSVALAPEKSVNVIKTNMEIKSSSLVMKYQLHTYGRTSEKTKWKWLFRLQARHERTTPACSSHGFSNHLIETTVQHAPFISSLHYLSKHLPTFFAKHGCPGGFPETLWGYWDSL